MADERPLTIAHVDAERGFSGGEVQVFLLMEGLRERGHRNVLLCPPGARAEEEARGSPVGIVQLKPLGILVHRRGARRLAIDAASHPLGRDGEELQVADLDPEEHVEVAFRVAGSERVDIEQSGVVVHQFLDHAEVE